MKSISHRASLLVLPAALVLAACTAKQDLPTPPPASPQTGTEGAQPQQPAEPPKPGQLQFFANLPFVWIPPGSFEMGSAKTPEELYKEYEGDLKWYAAERPPHKVTISKGFWLGKYEVTQAQWESVMGDNPTKQKGDDLPVGSLSWDDCQAFIAKLNALGQGTFRLPTEAEWEYACRAGTTTDFFFGDNKSQLGKYAWYFKNGGYELHPVGQKQPNAWQLFDMHGNAWEWCQDWFDADYYKKSPEVDPQGPETGTLRVLRSGTSKRTETKCRCAFRSQNDPTYRMPNQGIRLVRVAD